MATICGKLQFVDVSGGVWRLTADGTTYDLVGRHRLDRAKDHGAAVEVDGDVQRDAVGIGMGGGPTLRVRSVRRG